MGKLQGGQEAEGEGKRGQEPLLWFPGEGTGEEGQQARIGWFESFQGSGA